MPVKMKSTSEIKVRLGIQPNGSLEKFLVHACRIHMDKYVPYDIGTLANTALEEPKQIRYQQPYARVVYFGVRNGKDINYHLDKHPLAGPYWDKRMASAEMSEIVKEAQEFLNRGGK
jgi:hypothetical protein